MNRSQAIVVVVAIANLALMLIFPPYDSLAVWRGGSPSFDAFYFVFDRHYNKFVNADLLFIELYWILINAAIGWLLLRGPGSGGAGMSWQAGVLVFAALNLALVMLFPPF